MHNPKNTILIVGFMAQNTLGRKILEKGESYEKSGRKGPPPLLKFFNKEYPLKARVINLGGFSAHGDRNEMLRLLQKSNLQIKKIAVVHGEKDQAFSFAKALDNAGFQAKVPKLGESVSI
jgi:metallo-beta-lactamase family protein